MPLAGDSILVTPGTGATVATHIVSSKEHQVIMLADAAGNLLNDPVNVYASSALAMAKAASKNYISLFNADAALIVDVLGVWISHEITAAVTGLIRGYRLFFTNSTAHSAGTANTPIKLDSTTAALDADITVRSNGQTATAAGEAIIALGVGEEEAGSGGAAKMWLWNYNEMGISIVLRQNEGILVQQDSTAGTGVLSAGIIFRVR